MALYKYNTSDFLNDEISFTKTCSYFYTDTLSNAFEGDLSIDYSYEDTLLYVYSDNGIEVYYYTNITFVCDLSQIEGINGLPYYESLNLFARLNNEIDKLLFDNVETTLIDLGGTFINTSITTKTISYGMSITCIILFFIGILQFFKRAFKLIGGR